MMKIASMSDAALFLAQEAAPAAAPGQPQGNPLMQFAPLAFLMVAMYFFMIAPQRKKQKELQKMIDGLETGDEVLTAGGIIGEVTNRKGDRVVLRIADNTKVEVAKSFIQAVVSKAGSEKVEKA
jgi:preprotein translocase subunit YajC